MARKRKAQALGVLDERHPECKRAKKDRVESHVKHSVLQQYYECVQTLREYLLSKLPGSSRLRRKKIASLGKDVAQSSKEDHRWIPEVSSLLDTTLVCVHHRPQAQTDSRWEQWRSFSQKADESVLSTSGDLAGATSSQSEIVDFVIWQLFSRIQPHAAWPKHLLCDGFRRRAQNVADANGQNSDGLIPGLASAHPNHHVRALKDTPWPQILMILGKSGEQIMIDLLIDTAIYLPVKAGVGNLYQLSGIPLSETDVSVVADQNKTNCPKRGHKPVDAINGRLPSEITFVRNRMMYARAALTAKGTVQYGLRHIHVLSRCPHIPCSDQTSEEEKSAIAQSNERNTLKVMMYIFPRQFGLHNVFTSSVDRSTTSQKFADYTLREEEISSLSEKQKSRLPKRLRGDARRLVERLQLLHGRCSYAELLRHYCPSAIDTNRRTHSSKKTLKRPQRFPASQAPERNTQLTASSALPRITTQSRQKPRRPAPSVPVIKFDAVTELATPAAHVSAYCQAILAKIIPNEFWGLGEDQVHNKNTILRRVDHFIRMRRFESMALCELTDGVKHAMAGTTWSKGPEDQPNRHEETTRDT
ncbi:hypothetical protein LZ31DRAFT_40461 [Colletotrichum somersetense]|nr:hypothetical protein LZ31DRAFT_40461 [Colletotrichum somersetense]